MQNKLLIATNNSGKIREFRALLSELAGAVVVTPDEIGLRLSPREAGQGYAENALIKARAFHRASGGMVCLADDSGLEVDALDGAPGVYSARYTGQTSSSDADRRRYLLAQLAGAPRPRQARFVCCLALVAAGVSEQIWRGECHGEIIEIERGTNGFGYDPIFLFSEQGLTMAELDSEEKNRISHRARAVQAAMADLRKMMKSD